MDIDLFEFKSVEGASLRHRNHLGASAATSKERSIQSDQGSFTAHHHHLIDQGHHRMRKTSYAITFVAVLATLILVGDRSWSRCGLTAH